MMRRRGRKMCCMSLDPITLDKFPIRFEPKGGLVAQMQMPVAQFGMFLKQPVGERVALRPAMRLDAEGAARQPQHEMAVDLGRAVRRDDDTMLLGERGDAQGLGEAGGPRRVELPVADA